MNESQQFQWQLRLYLRGRTPLGDASLENLREIARRYLNGNCRLEIIDISHDVERATADDIVAVPTLIRVSPQPSRRIVGDLTRTERVLQALEILPEPEA